MKSLRYYIVVLLAILALSSTAFSQSVTTVEGHVRDNTGAPVKNQPVVIAGSTSKWWGTSIWGVEPVNIVAVTDDKGYFKVLDLPVGNYTVKLITPGAEPTPITRFDARAGYKAINLSDKLRLNDEQSTIIRGAPRTDLPGGRAPRAGETTTNLYTKPPKGSSQTPTEKQQ